jgi:PAS domain-containing protein
MLGIVVDVTERKRTEETLRTTKAALEFALESGQIGDWDLDLIRDTSIRSLRQNQCFGYHEQIPEADWGFEVFIQRVHPEERAKVESSFREAVENLLDWLCGQTGVCTGLMPLQDLPDCVDAGCSVS